MTRRDVLGGLLMLSIGASAIVIALGYPIGTAGRMGPGYMAIVLGGILVALGLIMVVAAMSSRPAGEGEAGDEGADSGIPIRPVLILPIAVVVFGLLLERVGLAIACVVTVLIASTAYGRFRPLETLALALILTTCAVLLFSVALGMPFRIWPS